MSYSKRFRICFKNSEQADELRAYLKASGMAWAEEESSNSVQEPKSEHQTKNPDLAGLTAEEKRAIDIGLQQFERGEVISWEAARKDLQKRIASYADKEDEGRTF